MLCVVGRAQTQEEIHLIDDIKLDKELQAHEAKVVDDVKTIQVSCV